MLLDLWQFCIIFGKLQNKSTNIRAQHGILPVCYFFTSLDFWPFNSETKDVLCVYEPRWNTWKDIPCVHEPRWMMFCFLIQITCASGMMLVLKNLKPLCCCTSQITLRCKVVYAYQQLLCFLLKMGIFFFSESTPNLIFCLCISHCVTPRFIRITYSFCHAC